LYCRGGLGSLEDFVQDHDALLFDRTNNSPSSLVQSADGKKSASLRALHQFILLHIINDFDTKVSLDKYLDTLNFLDSSRLRPSWDIYFMVSV
jgi:hypothetical protein